MVTRRSFLREESGISLTEAMLTFPIVMLIFAAFVEFGPKIAGFTTRDPRTSGTLAGRQRRIRGSLMARVVRCGPVCRDTRADEHRVEDPKPEDVGN